MSIWLIFASSKIFHNFLSSFSKLTFSKNYFRYTIRVRNSLDSDQARHFVGPGLDPNCFPRLSAVGTSRQSFSSKGCRILNLFIGYEPLTPRECSGSVVECLTQDQGAAGSSLTSLTVLCP